MNEVSIANGFRWLARIASLVSLAVLGMFFFGGQEEQQFLSSSEVVGFLFFPVCVAAGFLVAWKWELAGSLLSIFGLAGFYLWHVVGAGKWPDGPWFLIFASPAFLFLLAHLLRPDAAEKKLNEVPG